VNTRKWLLYALATTITWGVWGAFIDAPAQAGFPATLGFAVWSLTTIPVALWGLRTAKWGLDYDGRSVLLGSAVGFLGAGGQLLLFEALRLQPAYIVFPVISLYPMLTVLLSVVLLKERGGRRAWTGIILAAPALVLLSYQPPTS
jgi:drug/metabolite transporter (DMT)-like permease